MTLMSKTVKINMLLIWDSDAQIKDSNDAAYAHYTWSVQTGYNPAQGIKFVHNIQSKSPKRFDNLHRAHQLTCMSTISKKLDK